MYTYVYTYLHTYVDIYIDTLRDVRLGVGVRTVKVPGKRIATLSWCYRSPGAATAYDAHSDNSTHGHRAHLQTALQPKIHACRFATLAQAVGTAQQNSVAVLTSLSSL